MGPLKPLTLTLPRYRIQRMENITYSDSLTIVKIDANKIPVIDGASKGSLSESLSTVRKVEKPAGGKTTGD